eukprot:TRINITY_DN1810_c0_g1_i1.p1 TRINITY_DN1810_c0_g1~~TRINITY_DN1810_c0_g1_i1.p1  ORF type:complete len:129 (+),score=4.83 TRINITY_DN1810_c0_g1_i1:106-492(+)
MSAEPRTILCAIDPHESAALTAEECELPEGQFHKSSSVVSFENALRLVKEGDHLIIFGVISHAVEPDYTAIVGAAAFPAPMPYVSSAQAEESEEKKTARLSFEPVLQEGPRRLPLAVRQVHFGRWRAR